MQHMQLGLFAWCYSFLLLGHAEALSLRREERLARIRHSKPSTALGAIADNAGTTGRRRREGASRTSRPPPSTGTRPRLTTFRTTTGSASSNVPFDGRALTAAQRPNENAPPLDLQAVLEQGDLRCMTQGISFGEQEERGQNHEPWEFHSLNEICDGLSEIFNADTDFRTHLRMAIRRDIFDTTPFYANLSEKATDVLLSPDSSLEGSWRKPPAFADTQLRMVQTTQVLRDALGSKKAITGDELMESIGALCGPDPSTHFIDIYGVQDRPINHSWHMDAGMASSRSRTVLWGFPRCGDDDDNESYRGCGVFSHFVPLLKPCVAPESHPRMEPLLFAGTLPDKSSIVRPLYAPGRELMVFRDIDSLHSAPDVTYRMSLMRFM